VSASPAAATIGLVDYGLGNRRSMEKALARAGARVVLSGDHDALRATDGLVVPGVGAFNPAMRLLRERGLDELVRERSAAGVPVLGACLGMQLLFERSEERGGGEDGLGLLPGDVVRLDAGGLKLPHIGWNEVSWTRPSALSEGLADPATFYHVHSFVPRCDDDVVLGTSDYGSVFPSVVGRGSVFGTQFHPEKSSANGLALLANFVRVCARSEVAAA
jgi:imidazole glycerol-phosphate synthase subunit HisH